MKIVFQKSDRRELKPHQSKMVQCQGALRTLLCFAGFGLSFYALHVEHMKSSDVKYKALCDISEHMSCSKVFNSK